MKTFAAIMVITNLIVAGIMVARGEYPKATFQMTIVIIWTVIYCHVDRK